MLILRLNQLKFIFASEVEMLKIIGFIFVLLMVIIFNSENTYACLHFDNTYKGRLQEGQQEYFVFHDGENAHMIVRTELAANKFPKEIAWVIPFPTLPSKYQEEENVLFKEIYDLFQESSLTSTKGMIGGQDDGGNGVPNSKISVKETVQVGGYQIQPIEILADKAGNEFNQWLKKNKFNSMPMRIQKYYLKKGAVFLAIRMNMNLPNQSSLLSKPLHIIYKSDQIGVPMKFTHDQRQFDMDIYAFSKKKLNKDFSKMYLKKEKEISYKNEHLSPFLDSLIGSQKEGYITKYVGHKLNQKGLETRKIKYDPSFSKAELM